ncbi:type VI secretion system baseplate subunit TssE [Halorhodospira halophila]|uniref:IraD/Gp25-like domain-containing protein n=1 Tax=Halorhodospira halophila (strain DSM 244 / SL1) TaxID=349124 RepID=A1WTE0_HALHL|nr:type VI secretion system baseplate subunit TssE [Halorhodospira halophila]ABM60952.1 protein of unknown function DUF1316 [Halorhodospira halophila SL1]
MTVGLFDRLEGGTGRPPPHTGTMPGSESRASVVRHILRLLAARRGRPAHLAGYGLPDLSSYYHDLDGAAACLATAAQELIPRYEPRVVSLAVHAQPASVETGYVLWLALRAQLHRGKHLTLELAVDGNAGVHLLSGGGDGSASGV